MFVLSVLMKSLLNQYRNNKEIYEFMNNAKVSVLSTTTCYNVSYSLVGPNLYLLHAMQVQYHKRSIAFIAAYILYVNHSVYSTESMLYECTMRSLIRRNVIIPHFLRNLWIYMGLWIFVCSSASHIARRSVLYGIHKIVCHFIGMFRKTTKKTSCIVVYNDIQYTSSDSGMIKEECWYNEIIVISSIYGN